MKGEDEGRNEYRHQQNSTTRKGGSWYVIPLKRGKQQANPDRGTYANQGSEEEGEKDALLKGKDGFVWEGVKRHKNAGEWCAFLRMTRFGSCSWASTTPALAARYGRALMGSQSLEMGPTPGVMSGDGPRGTTGETWKHKDGAVDCSWVPLGFTHHRGPHFLFRFDVPLQDFFWVDGEMVKHWANAP